MRPLAAAFALLVCAGSAAAGPLDAVEFRATFRFNSGPGVGPAQGPNQTAYPLGGPPLFGVVVGGSSEWQSLSPAHPGADFAYLSVGDLTPYITGGLPDTELYGDTRYAFDFELRDAAGRVAVVPLEGRFMAGWSQFGNFNFPDASSGAGRLGGTRYDVALTYETSPPYYTTLGGPYFLTRFPPPLAVPFRDGDYTTQGIGFLYATVTPVPEPAVVGTPEPGTLALAAFGLVGVGAARRLRRASRVL